jgi:hypothetical protein
MITKQDHNTGGQNNTSETRSQYRWTKQHQRNMITIQVDKTTPVKQDHNTKPTKINKRMKGTFY